MLETGIGSETAERNSTPSGHRREFLYRVGAVAITMQIGRPLGGLAISQAGNGSAEEKEASAKVAAKVKKIIVEQLGVDEKDVVPSASLIDDLGADSLDVVELVMAMEEAFELEIPDEACSKWKTVGDVDQAIEADLEKKTKHLQE
jgi:acyl carrier protein